MVPVVLAPEWFDPGMPNREHCVLEPLLRVAAQECPDRIFAVFGDGQQWSFSEVYRRARHRAAGLQKLGVRRGDRVLVWMPNGPGHLITWFAANLLGACFVPVNPAYRGKLLSHVIESSEAKIMVAHADLVERLADIDTSQLSTVVAGTSSPDIEHKQIRFEAETMLDQAGDCVDMVDDLQPWDLQSMLYTSGTTGPSKGVLSSYFHQYTIATVIHGHMSSSDRILVNAPLFHAGGTGAVTAALIYRGSIALVDAFNAADFWQTISRTGATLTSGLLGSMAPYLAKTAVTTDAGVGKLRRTHFYPVSRDTVNLAKQCDFEYFSGYGMTELPFVLVTDLNTAVLGSCGRPRSGVECRLVDEYDHSVDTGEVGELIVRTEHTWSFSHGYNGMPTETSKAWRNGWFHSGDLFRQDDDGNFYFVDRKKDAIRRRGENISSQEVESVVYEFPAIQETAVLGVPGEYGEDEVMLVVRVREGELQNVFAGERVLR